MTASLFGVVGWRNSGQAYRGFHRSVMQFHHVFDIDHEGRDSFRFRAAGDETVAIPCAAGVNFERLAESDRGSGFDLDGRFQKRKASEAGGALAFYTR